MSLALEAVVVGAFLAIVLAAVVSAFPLSTWWSGAVAGFVIGVGTHLFFEYTGLNARYCKIGYACGGTGI